MPFVRGIFVASALKAVSGHCLYPALLPDDFVSVVALYLYGIELFGIVASGLMVEHCVEQHLHAIGMQCFDSLVKLGACAVFSAYGALLVEFTEVVEVVCGISFVGLFVGFIGWWNPHGSYSSLGKVWRILFELLP